MYEDCPMDLPEFEERTSHGKEKKISLVSEAAPLLSTVFSHRATPTGSLLCRQQRPRASQKIGRGELGTQHQRQYQTHRHTHQKLTKHIFLIVRGEFPIAPDRGKICLDQKYKIKNQGGNTGLGPQEVEESSDRYRYSIGRVTYRATCCIGRGKIKWSVKCILGFSGTRRGWFKTKRVFASFQISKERLFFFQKSGVLPYY